MRMRSRCCCCWMPRIQIQIPRRLLPPLSVVPTFRPALSAAYAQYSPHRRLRRLLHKPKCRRRHRNTNMREPNQSVCVQILLSSERWMWSGSASASVHLLGASACTSATAAVAGVTRPAVGIATPWSFAAVCCTGSPPSPDADSNSHFSPDDGAAHASTPPPAPPMLLEAPLAGDAGNSPATADSAAGGGTATPTTSKNPSSSTRPACVVAPAPEPAGPPPAFASACPACLARLLLEGALAAPLPAERSSAGRLSAEMRPLARTSCSSSAYAALATCRSAARDTGSNSSESEGSSAPAAPDNRA